MSARSLRVFSLVASSLVVSLITLDAGHGMTHAAGQILVALCLTAMGALAILAIDAWRSRTSVLARIDVLTANGAATLALGATALVIAIVIDWASLSVVGVLGVGIVYVSIIWSAIVASGDVPWRRATITRTITPERAVEGELLREEIRLTNVRIPIGMRLFMTGRAMRHGATSRYAVDARSSGADLTLASDLGPALRGDHHAPPLELWLGDVLGMTRTQVIRRAEVSFTVLPRTLIVDGARRLLGAGGDAADSMPVHAMPTEGSFRIREYVDGDDTRRIHWLRSLQQDRLIVRLPDEIPPADPSVRLILDNELAGVETLSCRAPDELLDTLVRVWLGIGKALAESGTRVTLVAAVANGDIVSRVERTLIARTSREAALQLGARVTWQTQLPLARLLEQRRERQIVVSSRPRRVKTAGVISWVAVPEVVWTTLEPPLARDPAITYTFPIGSAENRSSRRALAHALSHVRWHDRTVMSQVVCWTDWTRFSGDHMVRPDNGRAVLEVIS